MARKTRNKWWADAFFSMHYDLHADEKDINLGADLTEEHLRKQLEKVKPDCAVCSNWMYTLRQP